MQTWSQGHHMQGQGQVLDLQGQGQGLNSREDNKVGYQNEYKSATTSKFNC